MAISLLQNTDPDLIYERENNRGLPNWHDQGDPIARPQILNKVVLKLPENGEVHSCLCASWRK